MNDNDIQGNVVHAFNKPHQRFVMLQLPDDVDQARGWLEDLRGTVATGGRLVEHKKARKDNPAKPPTKLWTGVSLTWTGLRRLAATDLDAALRDDFAFRAGARARAGDLGDVGRSAPDHWLFGAVDAVVTLA